MERHKVWRLEYRANRYMRDLGTPAVLERAGDLLTYLFEHTPDGKISLKSVDLDRDTSGIQRFTHVLEELALRGVPYHNDGIIGSMHPPNVKSPKMVRALKTLSGRNWPPDILVKFGKRQYMADLLLAGRGRVSLVPRPLEKVLLNIFHWKCFRRILRYAELPAARLAAHSG
jgi:hypothetical protein